MNQINILLDMTVFGIKTFVGTTQEKIDWYFNEFKTQPDSKFGGGIGKRQLLLELKKILINEDKFFNKNISFKYTYKQRWENYLEDCVAFATLYSFMSDSDLPCIENDHFGELLRSLETNGFRQCVR
jgi:hypothetical protein